MSERREEWQSLLGRYLPATIGSDLDDMTGAAIGKADAEQEKYRTREQLANARMERAGQEIARLRTELDEERRKHGNTIEVAGEFKATIEHVRTVLDTTDPNAYVTNYSRQRERAIRTALEGKTNDNG